MLVSNVAVAAGPCSDRGGALAVTVTGEADLASAGRIEEELAAALAHRGDRTIIIDLGGLKFMDCAGAAALLRGLVPIAAGRQPILVRNASRTVRIVLDHVAAGCPHWPQLKMDDTSTG